MADRPIIAGVDGTTTGLRAVAWAAKEALLRGRPLRLVHAAPYLGTPDDPTGRGRAEAVLARARTLAHHSAPELTIDAVVLPDPPVSALIDASTNAELLVIGMIGGPGPEIVLGSVTLEVTTAAHCPVAVVRGETAADHLPHAHLKPVLLGIESVQADAAAVSTAFDDAERHHSPLIILQVPSRTGDLGHAATAVSHHLTPWRLEHPNVDVTVRIGQGNPALALLHESTHARHIVLGTRGRHPAVRALLGSVSRFVLRHSRVPVTIVPRSLSNPPAVPATTAADPHDRSQLW
jgi:nucleotide-binding universal stress UspA family protein